ncbi:hypothetical protein [Aeromonas veronii]|uniref:hypothetical protein n=1 Tax=Aeromonas veronii TaxID=654 RepID=UPI0011B1C62D|nr:hypothetical protein [Aeromonas veronii]
MFGKVFGSRFTASFPRKDNQNKHQKETECGMIFPKKSKQHGCQKPDHDGSPVLLSGNVAKKIIRKTTAQIPSGAPKRKGAFVMQRAELKEFHIKKPP